MNYFSSIDSIINNVKTLLDSCRCVSCDQLNKIRYRYSCGHSVCEQCIINNSNCVLCSPTSSNTSPVIDKPQSDRVRHAVQLLDSFQSNFNCDIYRKQRISEKLKTEKEIFPECIQAPNKYYNKRKSSTTIEKDDKWLPLFPGENIKMEKPHDLVQQWLKQNDNNFPKAEKSRLPFSELSVNKFNSVFTSNDIKKPLRKRKLNKTGIKTQCKKRKNFKCQFQDNTNILDDDIFSLSDSNESNKVNKDKLALISILEADAKETISISDSSFSNEYTQSNSLNETKQKKNLDESPFKPIPTTQYKVPFYKKGKLFDASESYESSIQIDNNKNVAYRIENTTINISDAQQSLHTHSKSVVTQTDNIVTQTDNSVVCEWDSDTDCESYKEVEVKADVHRSSKYENFILKPLEPHEYENRVIPKVKGYSPASSDSSGKENYDPNRNRKKMISKCKKKLYK